MLFPTPQNGKLTLRKFGDSKLLITDIGLFRSPAGPAVPAQVRYRPFSFFHRSRQGVAGGRRGGRARSRTSGGRLRAGGLGWYAPSGLSFPLRFACGPLPLTRPRVAMGDKNDAGYYFIIPSCRCNGGKCINFLENRHTQFA